MGGRRGGLPTCSLAFSGVGSLPASMGRQPYGPARGPRRAACLCLGGACETNSSQREQPCRSFRRPMPGLLPRCARCAAGGGAAAAQRGAGGRAAAQPRGGDGLPHNPEPGAAAGGWVPWHGRASLTAPCCAGLRCAGRAGSLEKLLASGDAALLGWPSSCGAAEGQLAPVQALRGEGRCWRRDQPPGGLQLSSEPRQEAGPAPPPLHRPPPPQDIRVTGWAPVPEDFSARWESGSGCSLGWPSKRGCSAAATASHSIPWSDWDAAGDSQAALSEALAGLC